jgi:hypothetical protein
MGEASSEDRMSKPVDTTDGRSTERRQDVEASGHHGREKNVTPSLSREIEGVILGEDSSTNEHEYARMKAPPRDSK